MTEWTRLIFATVVVLVLTAAAVAQPSTGGVPAVDAQLLAAAKRGDTAAVESLLQQGATIEAIDQNKETPLILVASAGHADTVKMLLNHGANVDARDEYDNTALIEAAQRGYTDIVKVLLGKHADVEVIAKYSGNALGLAAANGHTEIVKLLLDDGAKIDASGDNGATPLMLASKGSFETAKLLLDRKANLESKDKSGYSAIFYAAGWGKVDILKLLIERGANVTAQANNGITVLDNGAASCNKEIAALLREKGAKFEAGGNRDQQLVLAAEAGQIDIVKQLLDQGVSAGGVAGADTPLSWAAYCGQTEAVAFLLDHRANIDSAGKDKDTPLIKAAGAGHTETVALLLKRHANPEQKGSSGNTPLMVAAISREDTADIIKLLFDKGAKIEARDDNGGTALITAASFGNPANVVHLLDRHPNLEAENRFGQTALSAAAQQGRADIVKLLLDKGANIDGGSNGGSLLQLISAYSIDLSEKQFDVLKMLLDRGANVNARDSGGRTVLMNAALTGKTAAAGLLLDRRADLEARDNLGETALIKAANNGHTDTVQLLLEKGANVNAAAKGGDTSLVRAAGLGHAEIVKLLLDRGANLQVQGQSGRPALNDAAENGHEEIVKLLLDEGADIETRDKCEWTPLMDAAWGLRVSTVRLLLARGANVAVKAKAGCGGINGEQTPLRVACYNGSTEIAALLIDKGAPIDATTLFDAVGANKLAVVGFLLDKHASPDLHGDWRDQTETPIIVAASDGLTEMVNLLLDRGANIEARDKNGYTALMRAVTQYDLASRSNGHYETAKLLLDRGADPSASNNSGETALMLAKYNSSPQIIGLLKTARHTPRQEFEEQVAELAQKPNDLALLDTIIKFATETTPPPAIPEPARQAFIGGTTLLRDGHGFEATQKFDQAIKIAPWWADAYYNAAVADEKVGDYDDASQLLEKYLRFPLTERDGRDARDRMYAITAEKEGHKKDQEQYLREAATKYVTGGAQRVNENDAPTSWKRSDGCGVECLYAYRQNTIYIDRYYLNVFRMPNGHYIAVVLQGIPSGNGDYSGDRILVAEIADGRQWAGEYSFGALNEQFHPGSGSTYKVSISERSRDGVVSVTETQSGAGVTIPLSDLYSARYVNAFYTLRSDYVGIGGTDYNVAPEGGRTTASAQFFSTKLDYTHADPLSLQPSYVVVLDQADHPIASTGYSIRWHGNSWRVEK